MSAEYEGPAGTHKADDNTTKPRGGSSLTDAVVAALAKVDDKNAEPPPGEAKAPPPMVTPAAEPAKVEPVESGPNGFRSGPGSFQDLSRRWAGGAPASTSADEPAAPAPASEPARVAEPPLASPEPAKVEPAQGEPAPAQPPPVESAPVESGSAEPAAAAASRPQVGPIDITYYGRTDVGLVREHNEDNFLVADLTANTRGAEKPTKIRLGERGAIFAICDGMGGAAAGEVASQMAVDTIYEVLSKGGTPPDRDAFARRLVKAIQEAGHRIFSAAKLDRTRRGMGTTTTLAGLIDNVLFIGQVGDSRAYILRNRELQLVTKDQSLVNQLIEAGQLTEEEAEAFEHSNIILQALGTTEEVTVDLTFVELRPGDRLLLCSDGLSGLVHADMIKEAMQESPDLADAAAKLIQMANAGGGHDNISVILVDFAGEGLTAPIDARVQYQQYPLPPDDSVDDFGEPRETTMKEGAVKPGADVKREDYAAAVADEVTLPTRSVGKLIFGLIAAGFVIAILGAAWIILGSKAARPSQPDPLAPPVTREARPEPPTSASSDPPPQQARPPEPARRPQPEPPTQAAAPVAPQVPQAGTVRIRTDAEEGATLIINGEPRGPLTDGMTLELPPGAYHLEARSGQAQIASETVTVTAGEESAVTLSIPAAPAEPPAPALQPERTRQPPAQTDAPAAERRPREERPRVPRQTRSRDTSSGALPANPF